MISYVRRFLGAFKEYFLVVFLLVIALSVLSLNDSYEVKNLRRISLGTFSIFSSVIDGISGLFRNDNELLEQKRINAELMLQVNRLREYGLENIKLQGLLEFKQNSKDKLKYARVISKLVSDLQGIYVINLGGSDSITIGMPVITEKGLAGLVVEVSENFSLVRNLQNSNLKIAVTDQRSNVDGILRYNGTDLVIGNTPTTYDVAVGDRIITSDFSTIFPPSIPVGVITKAETDLSGVLTTLTVDPFADLDAIRNVFVLMVVQSKQIDSLELNMLSK